jgi:hypothetical protein
MIKGPSGYVHPRCIPASFFSGGHILTFAADYAAKIKRIGFQSNKFTAIFA